MLESRLGAFRLLHSHSVADTACNIAKVYGVCTQKAKLAGLLHDWDKDLSDGELYDACQKYGILLNDNYKDMAVMLHAQTGARAVQLEFPELDEEIITAIARHTSAAQDMSDLDMIIYVADMIEPLRSAEKLMSLRSIVGKVKLEALFLRSFEMSLVHLLKRHRFIHPDSLKVFNTYVARERATRPVKAFKQQVV